MAALSGLSGGSVLAAGSGAHPERATSVRTDRAAYWQNRDTATYVVSTLNLLRGGTQPFVKVAAHALKVTHFAVYADTTTPGLYFVDLMRENGSVAGSLAYSMGWIAPRALGHNLIRFGIPRASQTVNAEYRSDSKKLLGSFTSTLPN